MKACVLKSPNHIACVDVLRPKPKSGEVLIQIKACGICSSDLNRVYRNGAYHYPIILGHEIAGVIKDVGEDVTDSLINKHVTVFPLLPCNKCDYCKEDYYAQCIDYNYFGSRCDGGMAEFITVPLWNVNVIDDDVPYEIAALSEPMAVAVHAAKQIGDLKDKNICIIGTGTIGILCGKYLAASGASKVIFAVRNEKKRRLLNEIGFLDLIDFSKTEIDRFHKSMKNDVVIECVGSNDSIGQAIDCVSSRGVIVLIGNPMEDIRLSQKTYWKILRSELSVKGVWNSNYRNRLDDWNEAIRFITEEKDELSKLITHRFPMENVTEAFHVMEDKKVLSIKGVILNE